MAKVVQKKLAWGASPDVDTVAYKVYWSIPPAAVNYDSQSMNVGKVTEVQLPLAVMPMIDGELTIGISALDDVGNESDIVSATFPFDFQPPSPPGPPYLI